MRPVRIPASLILLLGLAGTAEAQTVPSPFEYLEWRHSVGISAGYVITDTGTRDVGPSSGPFGQIHYGIHLTGPLYAEALASYTSSERTVYRRPVATDPTLEAVGEGSVGIVLLQGGFRFSLTGARTWRGLAPYVTASGGLVTDIASRPSVEAQIVEDQRFEFGPGFAAGAGLGADFYLSDWLSIRAEAKDYLWRYGYPVGLALSEEQDSEWVQNFAISFGTAIHF